MLSGNKTKDVVFVKQERRGRSERSISVIISKVFCIYRLQCGSSGGSRTDGLEFLKLLRMFERLQLSRLESVFEELEMNSAQHHCH